jgi:hypothetical protein
MEISTPAGILPDQNRQHFTMDQKIYQLTYRSKARQGITTEEVLEIVDEAIAFNRRMEITGCLVFHQGYFVQILEGEKETVAPLYERIKKDSRHSQFDVLSKGMARERVFPSWNMGYMELDDTAFGDKDEFAIQAKKTLDTISTKNDFTPKVFWYNVHTLLSGTSFYKESN